MINLFKKSSKSKGFTLIELLVVVSIIGLLASIVVVSLGGSRVSSRNTKRNADLRQIQQALELCYNDRGCGVDVVTNDYPTLGTCAGIGASVATMNAYMAQTPVDPINSTPYAYACFSSGQRYCLSAKIEVEGGGGGDGTWTWVTPQGTETGKATAVTAADADCIAG